MIKEKTVVLGVSGSIAAYKIAGLASMLVKAGCQVHVIMTKNAAQFISPVTFETLTSNKCLVDTFDRNFQFHVAHVSLAKEADVVLVAPATANVIGKIAGGIADDMLTTTVMACRCPVLIAPAMNTRMFENPIVADNMKKLKDYGYKIIAPVDGYLACGDTGAGKMPEPETLFAHIEKELTFPKDFAGKNVLVTAGPTREAVCPVRFISNHSSGKMGYALAKKAALRGACVTLISGPVHLPVPLGVNMIPVISAEDMFQTVMEHKSGQDVVIKAAAVADYTPLKVCEEKMKKSEGETAIVLKRTKDILETLGKQKEPGQFLCGFSMETEHMLENSRKKLNKKHADMIVANHLKEEGAGFAGDTNVVTLITKDKEIQLPKLSKEETAERILDRILELHSLS